MCVCVHALKVAFGTQADLQSPGALERIVNV